MTSTMPVMTEEEAQRLAEMAADFIYNGAELWITIPTVSRSGMSYTVNARLIGAGSNMYLNYWLGYEMGLRLNDHNYLKAGGYGTDRGFVTADWLARALSNHGIQINANNIKRRWF